MSLIVEKLKGLSSAEEFFATLEVDYDPKVVAVSRLHILKRMGQLLELDRRDGRRRGDRRKLPRRPSHGLCGIRD